MRIVMSLGWTKTWGPCDLVAKSNFKHISTLARISIDKPDHLWVNARSIDGTTVACLFHLILIYIYNYILLSNLYIYYIQYTFIKAFLHWHVSKLLLADWEKPASIGPQKYTSTSFCPFFLAPHAWYARFALGNSFKTRVIWESQAHTDIYIYI